MLEPFENNMNGYSLLVPPETALEEIPPAFRELLSLEEQQAFIDSESYFHRSAEKSNAACLRNFQKELAETCLQRMEIHTSKYIGNTVLFRFSLPNDIVLGVSLPHHKPPPSVPDALAELYASIGSTKHADWEMAGGIFKVEMLCDLGQMGTWLSEEMEEDPKEYVVFYGTTSGDNLCFKSDGSIHWYNHEFGGLSPAGNIDAFLEAYYSSLLEGKELQGGYY
jgi:hypothetical protein